MTPTPDPAQLMQHGANEAAQALGRMLRAPVTADTFTTLEPDALATIHGATVVAIAFDTTGGVLGSLVILIDDGVAAWLAGRLTGVTSFDGVFGKGALAALAELGNIAASAFLNGAARLVQRTCLPSVPRVSHAPARDAIAADLPARPLPVATLRVQQHWFSLVFAPGP